LETGEKEEAMLRSTKILHYKHLSPQDFLKKNERPTHHDHASLIIGQHDGHEARGGADSCKDVLNLCLPIHLGHWDKSDR
jgi:hypothetical protein